MRTVVLLLGLGTAAALTGCGAKSNGEPDPGSPPVAWSAEMQAVADGQNRFALELYARLRRKEKGNVFYSPYSVHTALAMTATGARGNTRKQMEEVLHLPGDDRILAAGDIGRYYGHPRKDFELSVANALWGQKGLPWRPEWLRTQDERFGAGFQEADFAGNLEGERVRINKWVEEKTRERIKELLLREQMDPKLALVLTNAIYFKGRWATQFEKGKTRPAPFHCDDNTTVDVPMMSGEVKCRSGGADGVAVLELPYRGDELSMVVVLPGKGETLAALEKRLTPELLAKCLADLKPRDEMAVAIPKFKIESRYELPACLKALGMTDAFDRQLADFTGMLSAPPVYISFVTHKAFVDVNEEGTEAAAATAVGLQYASAKLPFRADRPFLFLIRDARHGTVLFMGCYEKP